MEQIKTILIKITIGRKKILEQAQIDGGRFQEGCGEENWGGCGYGEGEREGEGEGVGGEAGEGGWGVEGQVDGSYGESEKYY